MAMPEPITKCRRDSGGKVGGIGNLGTGFDGICACTEISFPTTETPSFAAHFSRAPSLMHDISRAARPPRKSPKSDLRAFRADIG